MKNWMIPLLCLLPFISAAQGKYKISGQITDPDNAGMVYLRYNTNDGLKTDSTKLINGKFTLTGPVSSIMEGYLSTSYASKTFDQVKIYLEPKEMTLNSPTRKLKDAVITGSKVNEDNQLLQTLLKPVNDQSDALMKKWRSTPDKERDSTFRKAFLAQQVELELEARAIKKKFALGNLNSYIGLIASLESGSMDFNNNFEGYVQDFNKFSAEVRATDFGKSIQETIDGAMKTRIGLTALDFSQKDVKGKTVRLSDFRGKYVLLDFWASWCHPCREETPHLVKAYQKFKDKKFTILSVSLDKADAKAAWLKAIANDGMVWTNVSDLHFWRNEAAILYGIKSVPANFLIDPNGKIIARDLRGVEVEQKLAALLN